MTDSERLEQMVHELRRVRESCEPKAPTNKRYQQLSQAVSAINWMIADLRAEDR